MVNSVVIISSSLVLLAINPFRFVSILHWIPPAIMLLPGMAFIPSVVKAVISHALKRQCLPAEVETATLSARWNRGVELTLTICGLTVQNPPVRCPASRSRLHIFQRSFSIPSLLHRFRFQFRADPSVAYLFADPSVAYLPFCRAAMTKSELSPSQR